MTTLLVSALLASCGSDSGNSVPSENAGASGGASAGEAAGGALGEQPGAGGARAGDAGANGMDGGAGSRPDGEGGAAAQAGLGEPGGAGAGANGDGAGGTGTDELVTTLLVGPNGGTLRGYYGADLSVPAGALDAELTLSLLHDSEGAPGLADADELGAAGSMYALLPHGTTFAKPVTVRVPFDPTQVPDRALLKLFKAESGGSFTPVPATLDGDFLVAELDSFSWVIAGFSASRPRVVYALSSGASGSEVAAYPIDPATGNLKPKLGARPVGQAPTSVALHPSGRFLFVANAAAGATQNGIASDSVASFPVSLTAGTIGPLVGAASTALGISGGDTGLVVHPSGKFLYAVVDQGLTAGSIVRLAIRPTDGQLSAATVVLTGPNVTPRAFEFDPSGRFAYVGSEYTPGGAGANYQLLTYPIDAQGNFGAALGSATLPQDVPSAVAVHPTGQFVYVATQDGSLSQFRASAVTGLASAAGSVSLTGKPVSLAADTLGAFVYAGRVNPYNNLNLFSFAVDATTGALSQLGSGLGGCSQGSCVQTTVVTAEPQGDFVYALNGNGEMTAFKLNRNTGALTAGSAISGVPTRLGTPRLPWKFAAGGKSPLWLNRCTTSCAMTASSSPSTPPTPPTPTTAILTVTRGTLGGHVTSSPGGIDYGDGLDQNHFSAEFPIGTSVSLHVTPPAIPAQGYDVVWLGDCAGTSNSTAVTLSGDKQCQVDLRPVSTR